MRLDQHITITDSTPDEANLCHHFTDTDLRRIGSHVLQGYKQDVQSRLSWFNRNEAGMNLALQMVEEKSTPWAGASNVAFPLVTIAALQFHSRAYPALISGTDIVKFRTIGADPSGEELARARRVGIHMSYQVLEEDQGWEEAHDRLLINVPIVGCAFTKCFRDVAAGMNVTTLVLARDLVVDYFAKSAETAIRISHIIPKMKNDIWEAVKLESYRDILDEPWYKGGGSGRSTEAAFDDQGRDERQGLDQPMPDKQTPFIFLEQHCWLDLDDDGYAEPYIITVEEESGCVVRIVARWHRKEDVVRLPNRTIVKINVTCAFTKYELIPSPDGGFYGMGFGVLLGPLNEAVNTLINQLIDSGTLSNTAGGFLGRGAKIRGGNYSFSPFEWKRVDSTGDDLRKNIVPATVREPSNVLFQVLGLLIDYTNRISGATEMLAGQNPGQNTPAANGDHMVEQGLKVYSAIFKRIWRAMKGEFRKLYILNAMYMAPSEPIPGGTAMRADYLGDPNKVCPVADPTVVSDQIRMQQAMMLAQRASMVPGYNQELIEKNLLQASRVEGYEAFYPGPEKTGPLPNPKAQAEQAKAQGRIQELQLKLKANAMLQSIKLMEEHALNEAKIAQLQAQSENLLAQAKGVETGHLLAMIDAEIGQTKVRNADVLGRIKSFTELVRLGHDIHTDERAVPDVGDGPSNEGAQGAPAGTPS